MNEPHEGTRSMARPLPPHAAPEAWACGALEWSQTHWHRSEWVLSADGEPIASLNTRGTFRERTLGHGPSGDWEIRERWTGAARITRDGGPVVASYDAGWWGGGTITTASGTRYAWTWAGFWKREYQIATESGFPCVRFLPRSLGARDRCAVVIDPQGMRVPELEAFLLLGWRILIASRSHAH